MPSNPEMVPIPHELARAMATGDAAPAAPPPGSRTTTRILDGQDPRPFICGQLAEVDRLVDLAEGSSITDAQLRVRRAELVEELEHLERMGAHRPVGDVLPATRAAISRSVDGTWAADLAGLPVHGATSGGAPDSRP
ncbi:MAG TPA: hypothetical protein VEA69_10535 [Tepidisphaeraceae bacterium]|nr:hypothetical protein [Tepidisphaeraceae bacterium]